MNPDNYGRSYLQITLEINKQIDGYVDAYYGPDELKAAVKAAPKREPAALLDDVTALQASIPDDDPARQAYLTAELRAIECSVRMLNGEQFAFLDEIAGELHQWRPAVVKAHETLHARFFGRMVYFGGFLRGAADRFFAKDMLAGANRGQGHLFVKKIW